MNRWVLAIDGPHAGERQPWEAIMEELRGRLEAEEYMDVRHLLQSLAGRDHAALLRALRRQDEVLYQAYQGWWADELRRRRVEVTLRRSGGRAVE